MEREFRIWKNEVSKNQKELRGLGWRLEAWCFARDYF